MAFNDGFGKLAAAGETADSAIRPGHHLDKFFDPLVDGHVKEFRGDEEHRATGETDPPQNENRSQYG